MRTCKLCGETRILEDWFDFLPGGAGPRRWKTCNICRYEDALNRLNATEKTCTSCKETKLIENFAWDNRPGRYFQSRCKSCDKKRYDSFYEENPDRRRDIILRSKYGITLEEWNLMFWEQGQCCAICLTTEPCGKRGWQTDHCHETGGVRGILCFDCNVVVGKIENGWMVYIPAIQKYLEDHDALVNQEVGREVLCS